MPFLQPGYVYFDGTKYITNPTIEIVGPPGPPGPQGPTGTAGGGGSGLGPQGSPGVTGARGATGTQGIQGSPGVTGSQGVQGSPGVTGTQGVQGSPGVTGTQGVQGSPGVTGTQGIQGSPGVTGVQGPAGSITGTAGGDLGGTYPNPIVVALTGTGGVVTSAGALTFSSGGSKYISFLSNPANTGYLRFPYQSSGDIIVERNESNNNNYSILSKSSTINTLGNVSTPVGVVGTLANIYAISSDISLSAASGIKILNESSAESMRLVPGNAATGTVAATGIMRFPNNSLIIGSRNATNNGDIPILGTDTLNNINIGQSVTTGAVQVGRPIIGLSSAWGSINGIGTQAMADADQTPTASVYKYGAIKLTGVLSNDRTLTLPAATDDQGYMKWINNTCTDVIYNVIISVSGAPATVTIANSKSAFVWIDNRGVTRMTADI